MTVIDIIYGVKAHFKGNEKSERSVDKLLMKVFVTVMMEAKREENADIMREAESLYLRIN